MTSLRWRIAAWYAALLLTVILALALIITFRFEAILYDEAQQHVFETMQDIERATLPTQNGFAIGDIGSDPLLPLEDPDNLERWASTSTFIEVDDAGGYPLAKSFNMGRMRFPPAPALSVQTPIISRRIEVDGRPFLLYSRLFVTPASALVAQVGEPLDQLNQAFAQTQNTIIIVLVIAAAAVVLLSLLLAGRATNPINQLARAMREIGSDRLNRRLRWKGRRDEIGRLAETFDDLLARLEEAFARERQFIADASHELKTPLTSINANAQLLERWGDRDQAVRKESLETIENESASLAQMVTGMLTLARADSGDDIPKESISLAGIAGDAAEAARPRAQEKGLRLDVQANGVPARILGDPSLVRQLAANLLDNAIKFTQSGGVTVRTAQRDGEAILEVEDTGPGIDPKEIPLIFDRFYRSDKSRNRDVPGTGLGLAIVRSIARVHGGRVEAENCSSGGTLFRARFPAAPK